MVGALSRGGWLAVLIVAFVVGLAQADWDPGDYHKMHYPQLPDPEGWDVRFHDWDLADDWQCSETGFVDDVHLWVSFAGWNSPDVPPGVNLNAGAISIWSNIPLGPDGYSIPGVPLWTLTGQPTLNIRHYGTGNEGWYDPATGTYVDPDHTEYFQINITDIPDPFYQTQGEIYWLVVNATGIISEPEIGWKTSKDHFMDDAVWYTADGGGRWIELVDPITFESLDLAFVITPEPATMALLLAGSALLLRRRRAS